MPPSVTISGRDSLGEPIQAAFPRTRVVKTLNTMAAEVMVQPSLVGASSRGSRCGFADNALGAYRLTQAFLPGMNARANGRVVNVSSGMGALTDMGTGWPGDRISKTALNAITLLFHGAAGPGVLVNAVCPGWVRTDMGGSAETRSVSEGAAGIVLAACLRADGPSGAFLRDGARIDR